MKYALVLSLIIHGSVFTLTYLNAEQTTEMVDVITLVEPTDSITVSLVSKGPNAGVGKGSGNSSGSHSNSHSITHSTSTWGQMLLEQEKDFGREEEPDPCEYEDYPLI